MTWREKLFSNVFIRNVLASFGGRRKYRGGAGEITPYFLFKVGPYRNDLFLYFSSKPFPLRYKNEIFNKLEEYAGHDVIRYLEFHYSAYPDSIAFLEFLYYEVSERLKESPRKAGLLLVRDWIERKNADLSEQRRLQTSRQADRIVTGDSHEIRVEVNDNLNKSLFDFQVKLEAGVSQVLLEAEKSMRELASSFSTGTIELNNRVHEDRMIQLFILIQQIKAPGRAEQLFKKMNATDIAAIFHLHFQTFHENKLTTVQRKITEQAEQIRPSQAKVKRLSESLADFFY